MNPKEFKSPHGYGKSRHPILNQGLTVTTQSPTYSLSMFSTSSVNRLKYSGVLTVTLEESLMSTPDGPRTPFNTPSQSCYIIERIHLTLDTACRKVYRAIETYVWPQFVELFNCVGIVCVIFVIIKGSVFPNLNKTLSHR